jgi:hypothetical protein
MLNLARSTGKCCHVCTSTPWTCRECRAACCEHKCGFKDVEETLDAVSVRTEHLATCTSCSITNLRLPGSAGAASTDALHVAHEGSGDGSRGEPPPLAVNKDERARQRRIVAFEKAYIVNVDEAGEAISVAVRAGNNSGRSVYRTIWRQGGAQRLGPTTRAVIDKARSEVSANSSHVE